jgi:crotonobetainyl-CoA:carnitine CoA-transferase CaiB-like acyl-CoA transferase
MGFGYDVLRQRNPRIISIHMPGCGRRGPWRDRGSFGNMIAAASGLSWLTGFPGRSPRGLGVAHPDFTGPYLLAMTAVAALARRDRTGEGEELEVNQLNGTISLLGVEWLQYATTGEAPPMRANRDPNWCPHGVYPATGDDEWVAVACRGDSEWAALCGAMGLTEARTDLRFSTHALRKRHEDDLDKIISSWTSQRSKWDAAEHLQATGVAAAPVEHLADAIERDPYLSRWIERVRQPTHPDIEVPIPGEAIQVAGDRRTLVRAPRMGEHNDEVLREILGLAEADIDDLRRDEVIW